MIRCLINLLRAFVMCCLPLPVLAEEVTVFAAASLKTALDEIAERFAAETPHQVTLSYAGSATLARQIIFGAPAQVFIPAHPRWMDAVDDEGLIHAGSRIDLLGNSLVLIAHDPGPPIALDASLDLPALLNGGRLAMGLVDAVPAGEYGKAALSNLGLWESVRPLVAQTDNVRAALALVALGEAPLGVVYASDARADPRVTILGHFPETSHPPIRYPAALIEGEANESTRAFLSFLRREDSRNTFLAQGFTLPGG